VAEQKAKLGRGAQGAAPAEGEVPIEVDERPGAGHAGALGGLQDGGPDQRALGDGPQPQWYDVLRDEKSKPCSRPRPRTASTTATAQELLECVREAGRAGANIQRYKVWASMNPGAALGDHHGPKRRRLLQVTLDEPGRRGSASPP